VTPARHRLTLDDCVARLRDLARGRSRTLLGIAGPPGCGKSTLAAALADRLGTSAVVVGMDGFHLAQAELARLGRADRKGAPDTFDAAGYAALLKRLRDDTEEIVYAPLFRREIEEPIAGAVAVDPSTAYVITEGNYLLLDEDPWRSARAQLDEVWYLYVPDDVRRDRLVQRRLGFGASEADAQRWALGSDERNAVLVAATRERADLVVELVTS
jgi:pantothenate kinase